LRGIQRCLALIDIGHGLEEELKLKYGQFCQRPDRISGKIGTESASRIVYPAVLAAYTILGRLEGGVANCSARDKQPEQRSDCAAVNERRDR
jgi:hypothetical protein